MVNTKNTLIAERYSEALIGIAKDGKLTFDKISKDLELIKNTLLQSKDLEDILNNPIVSIENKKEILEKVFSGEIDNLILNLLKLLVEKNRFVVFSDVIVAFKKSLDDINNISRVDVTSAIKMTKELEEKLKTKLEEKLHKNVILNTEINPDIIAGLIIKIGDNIIDTSLKHKLEDLGKTLIK